MARRYARDNRGRFASGGGGATARGGRLRTAAGNKRKTQTMQASAAPKGTIGKPRGLKPQSAKPAPSAATIAQVGRERRATRNLNAAMKREAEGPGSKASRSASVAKRARAIYAGKVDPKQKTAARLTRTNNPEALRKRIKKIKDNNAAKPARAAAKPAAKPARSRSAVGKIDDAKADRIIQRHDAMRPGLRPGTGSKARAMNSINTFLRARKFLLEPSRKVAKKGETISGQESIRRAVASASKKARNRK